MVFAVLLPGPLRAEERPLFAWFSDLKPGQAFWELHKAFTLAAARDLNVDITTYWSAKDQHLYERQLNAAATGEDLRKPADGLIFVNMKKQGRRILGAIERNAVPAMLNVDLLDHAEFGKPRERYRHWIGEMQVDEEEAGYILATRLIREARQRGMVSEDGKVHLIAISGHVADHLTHLRTGGLKRAVEEDPGVVLEQIFHTKFWSREEGRKLVRTGLRRYPQATVVWSINDGVALGVIEGAKAVGRTPGSDLLTGGMDWVMEGLDAVAKGESLLSVGGMFMHGGWSVVLLYDYLHGNDFRVDEGVVLKTANGVLDSENVAQYLALFADGNWDKVDFRRFSKVLNPEMERYDFSHAAILRSLER
ncbi:MAG: ABC transporter substrate-binding protein [Magnetococcales bacterium]|nr:ABC transporter substrate-binding protein [Magnetococcales bacterium]